MKREKMDRKNDRGRINASKSINQSHGGYHLFVSEYSATATTTSTLS